MRTITAPGVEIKEIDKSGYSPAMTGTACYVMGFAGKGEAYNAMQFTGRSAFVTYYGEPTNEPERYFYNTCMEVLNQNGVLYCARLPYDNESFEKAVAFKYDVTTGISINDLSSQTKSAYTYPEITKVDSTITDVAFINGSETPYMIDLSSVDAYRTDEEKAPANGIIIVDKTGSTYKKIIEDDRKGKAREILGIVPVITTAANGLYAQKLIEVEKQNVKFYENLGFCHTLLDGNDGIKYYTLDDYLNKTPETVFESSKELVTQINTIYKDYDIVYKELSTSIDTVESLYNTVNSLKTSSKSEDDIFSSLTAVEDLSTLESIAKDFNKVIDEFVEKIEASTGTASTEEMLSTVKSCYVLYSFDEKTDVKTDATVLSASDKITGTIFVNNANLNNAKMKELSSNMFEVTVNLTSVTEPIPFDELNVTFSENIPLVDEPEKEQGFTHKITFEIISQPDSDKNNFEIDDVDTEKPVNVSLNLVVASELADAVTTVGEFADKVKIIYSKLNTVAEYHASDGDDSIPSTVSLDANTYFPTIIYNPETAQFERDNLKKIGVVVYKTYIDPANGNKIAFEPVESFVGSLNKNDKDPNTGVTTFIDTIVNSQSEYIYFFSNCFSKKADKKVYENLDMIFARPCDDSGSLAFFSEQTVDDISIDKSILDGINKCFEKVSDINERDIDIIPDAGISNIASYLKAIFGNKGRYDMNITNEDTGESMLGMWKADSNNDALKIWRSVIQKYDNFCKNVRKDCMFIADGPRPLVLQGQKKIIRSSKPTNTIDTNILPYIMYITGLNTSYGAGYLDWYQVADEYTGDFFWLPPSAKAMAVYLNTDINYNYWDAPAGLNRGVIAALDVAFSPNSAQAGSIYEKNWNYSIKYPNDGIVLEGQKTFQVKPSAFDRVNVRRLFLRLERATYKAARYFVYEGNTAYNRQRLVDSIDPYFREAKVGGGVYDYKIICDDTNNDPTTIDRNEMKVAIGIKPVKSAEFILVDFIALSTGGSFEEAMG